MGLFSQLIDSVKSEKQNLLSSVSEAVGATTTSTTSSAQASTLAKQIVNNVYNRTGEKLTVSGLSNYGYNSTAIAEVSAKVSLMEKPAKMESSIKTVLSNYTPSNSTSVTSSSENIFTDIVNDLTSQIVGDAKNTASDLITNAETQITSTLTGSSSSSDSLTGQIADALTDKVEDISVYLTGESTSDPVTSFQQEIETLNANILNTFSGSSTTTNSSSQSSISSSSSALETKSEYTGSTDLVIEKVDSVDGLLNLLENTNTSNSTATNNSVQKDSENAISFSYNGNTVYANTSVKATAEDTNSKITEVDASTIEALYSQLKQNATVSKTPTIAEVYENQNAIASGDKVDVLDSTGEKREEAVAEATENAIADIMDTGGENTVGTLSGLQKVAEKVEEEEVENANQNEGAFSIKYDENVQKIYEQVKENAGTPSVPSIEQVYETQSEIASGDKIDVLDPTGEQREKSVAEATENAVADIMDTGGQNTAGTLSGLQKASEDQEETKQAEGTQISFGDDGTTYTSKDLTNEDFEKLVEEKLAETNNSNSDTSSSSGNLEKKVDEASSSDPIVTDANHIQKTSEVVTTDIYSGTIYGSNSTTLARKIVYGKMSPDELKNYGYSDETIEEVRAHLGKWSNDSNRIKIIALTLDNATVKKASDSEQNVDQTSGEESSSGNVSAVSEEKENEEANKSSGEATSLDESSNSIAKVAEDAEESSSVKQKIDDTYEFDYEKYSLENLGEDPTINSLAIALYAKTISPSDLSKFGYSPEAIESIQSILDNPMSTESNTLKMIKSGLTAWKSSNISETAENIDSEENSSDSSVQDASQTVEEEEANSNSEDTGETSLQKSSDDVEASLSSGSSSDSSAESEDKYSKYESELDKDRNLPSIGKIYVMPPFDEASKLYTIELQNNIMFKNMSRQASYNSLSFFGRIGDIKQYTNTGSLEQIEVTTDYFVESEDSSWTMEVLQIIESKYKSLVLPSTTTNNSFNNTYKGKLGSNTYQYFTRPPVINIVLGNTDSYGDDSKNSVSNIGISPVNNLFTNFTYDSSNKKTNITYKNFVVTNVSIDKDTEKYPYYVTTGSDTNTYLDTIQFSVTLDLLEIDANYLSSMPSFDDYVSMLGWENLNGDSSTGTENTSSTSV